MELIAAQLVNGITLGSTYALVALGFTFVYSVLKLLQLAHGELIVATMYIAWQVYEWTGNMVLGFVAGMIIVIILSLLMERFGFRYLRQRQSRFHEPIVLAIAIAMLLTELFAQLFNSGEPAPFPSSITSYGAAFNIGLTTFTEKDIYIIITALIVLFGFTFFLNSTKHGRALRAVAVDWKIARLLGIPVERAAIMCFIISGALAGVTGILLEAYLGSSYPSLGGSLSFKGIAIMLFAGAGSFIGAGIMGVTLGIIEVMTLQFIGGAWRNGVAFAAIIIVLMFRPQGVFGTKY